MKTAVAPTKEHSGERKEFSWEVVTAISTAVLTATTLFALVFSWRQIRDFRQAEQVHQEAEQVHQVVEQVRYFTSTEFRQVRKSLATKRLDSRGKLVPLSIKAVPEEMYEVLNYFEEIGLLERKGYLNAEDIWEELGYWALNTYEDAKPVIAHDRQEDPTLYTDLERLINLIQQVEKSKTGKPRALPSAEIEDFYRYQKKLLPKAATK